MTRTSPWLAVLRRAGAVAAALVLVALGAATASAHALAVSSDPASGAELGTAPSQVTITFGETPDVKLSAITVVDTSGAAWTSGPTVAVPGDPLQLQVPLKHLPRGVYTVTWRTVSSVDGHLAAGAFAFGVGESPSQAQRRLASAGTSSNLSALAVIARAAFFAGVVTVLGAGVVSFAALRTVPPRVATLLVGGAVVASLGTFGVVDELRSGAGISWSAMLDTSLGRSLLQRGDAGAALLVCAVGARLARGDARRFLAAGAAAAAAAAMAVDALTSHAGAESPVWFNEVLQWVHIVAVGVWIGGLATLVVSLRELGDAMGASVRRFSTIAAICLVVVLVSGVIRAAVELQTFAELVDSWFGRLVILKAVLIGLLALLGALNRYRHVPDVRRRAGALRRAASGEVVLGLAALTVAAGLVNLAPPIASAQASTAAAQPVVVTGNDFATTVRVRLTVSPGTAGFNDFTLTANDYDTGAPVNGTVELDFQLAQTSAIGSSTLQLRRTGAGVYTARGSNLSVDGRWNLTALIEETGTAVEVPLSLTTRSTPPQVTVQHVPGLPTLYTIQLSQGRTLQVYLDPDRPGHDQFHSTFFAAGGNGTVPITTASVTMTPPGGQPENLPLQLLGPGHFVGAVTVPQATVRFDIVGSTPSGEVLGTHIELTPGAT